MFIVYVLKNGAGRIYIGQTQNSEIRLLQHNKRPKRGYRESGGPFSIVYQEVFSTRVEAMWRGKMLKSGQGREWLKNFLEK